ncbi:hypothetical protein [Legionella impletisoli]|uniref:Secreted protein n=1 Tax=Legionella impletisoli TaxID=343510 RepID=A0A917JV39_9GAMM|nr:hypothetical protein [Legionella impletisoli]GGI88285.1 hypothetical protein GCM10007966_16280 [Legionella impletisoli]
MGTRTIFKSLFGFPVAALLAAFLGTSYSPLVQANSNLEVTSEQKPVELAFWWVHRDRYYTYGAPGYYYRYWTDWRQVSPRCQRSCLVNHRGYVIRCVRRCY